MRKFLPVMTGQYADETMPAMVEIVPTDTILSASAVVRDHHLTLVAWRDGKFIYAGITRTDWLCDDLKTEYDIAKLTGKKIPENPWKAIKEWLVTIKARHE